MSASEPTASPLPTSQTAPDPLPHWDLSPLYPGLASREFQHDMELLRSEVAACEEFFAQRNVQRLAESPTETDGLAAVAEVALRRLNSISLLHGTLDAFVYGELTTDSYNTLASRETSRLEQLGTRRHQLGVRLAGWLGSLGGDVIDSLITQRPLLKDHAFFIRHTAEQSRYLMDERSEQLAAELCVDSGAAFGRLQGNITSQIKVPLEQNGKTEQLPIAAVHNLCSHPDRALRHKAYQAEIAGWSSVRTTVAACLNGVKGTAITLAKHRGRPSVLDEALDDNRIDAATLDALLESIREYLPVFRRYLHSKATKLGLPRLAWWDLFAPVGAESRQFSWPDAQEFIVSKFTGFHADLGKMAERAFTHRWIDAPSRDGKRGGAYCMPVPKLEESRILANFDGSFDGVSTLAHELGHAFHNDCQRGLEPLRRGAPSTLAETASIFCETLICEAALANSTAAEQLAILETQLCGATQVCLDILSRFLFESQFIERRQKNELSPDEICELMTDAQHETYADGVEEATYHPYMWLWKPHYYSYNGNFYNFPYAFGHLFALGLYAQYRQHPRGFVERYKQLLRDTAQDYAAPLAQRFGLDLTTPDFWRGSLSIVEEQITRYEQLDA